MHYQIIISIFSIFSIFLNLIWNEINIDKVLINCLRNIFNLRCDSIFKFFANFFVKIRLKERYKNLEILFYLLLMPGIYI